MLTAHHREDQIETHLIRRRAHSGADGLAGMSAIRELADCRLLRPLLGCLAAAPAALAGGRTASRSSATRATSTRPSSGPASVTAAARSRARPICRGCWRQFPISEPRGRRASSDADAVLARFVRLHPGRVCRPRSRHLRSRRRARWPSGRCPPSSRRSAARLTRRGGERIARLARCARCRRRSAVIRSAAAASSSGESKSWSCGSWPGRRRRSGSSPGCGSLGIGAIEVSLPAAHGERLYHRISGLGRGGAAQPAESTAEARLSCRACSSRFCRRHGTRTASPLFLIWAINARASPACRSSSFARLTPLTQAGFAVV